MDGLQQFQSLKYGWDHSFFKAILRQFLDEDGLEKEKEILKCAYENNLTPDNILTVAEGFVDEDYQSIAGR